jgi:hypothetical protein
MRLTPMTDSQTDNECFKSSKENLGFQLNMNKFNLKQYLKGKLCKSKWFKATKKIIIYLMQYGVDAVKKC